MAHKFSNLAKGALATILLSSGAIAQAADSDMPLIMTLKTNIYSYQGPSNYFTIYLGSTEENVEVCVETASSEEYITLNPWSLGTDSDGDNAVIATAVNLNVTESNNTVKIYGDKSKIDYIDVHGCYLSSIDLEGEFPNLIVVDYSHNELTSVDLSKQYALASIDISDNLFTDPNKMIIGENHPGLEILSVGLNEVIDPNLSLTNFPRLQYFSARNNYGITSVDPTQCPDLVSLVLEITNISSVDVSKNTKLDVLNLSQTRIKSVDLSNNKVLGEFYINHEGSFNNEDQYRVQSIDLSNNPLLQYVDLGGNSLTSIDLSNNPDIRLLYLQRNRLTNIDVSNLSKLAVLNLSNNFFNFATLPIPEDGWDYYYYRTPLACDFKYKVGDTIDFSSEVIRAPFVNSYGSTVTPITYAAVFAAPRGKDEYEVDASLYTYDEGKITFKEALPDSVYVQFYCDVFPDWPLNSANFMVKTPELFDAPSAAFSFVPDVSMSGKSVSMQIGATIMASSVSYPADVTIIAGENKTEIKNAVTGAGLPQSANVTFTIPNSAGTVTVALPDGFGISALALDGIKMSSIDLSPAEMLTDLALTNCSLPSINLEYNSSLKNLDLTGNSLTTVDLAGVRGDFQKYNLSNINLSNNQLTSLETVSAATIYNLNLSNNNFTNFDLKYYTGLKSINLSNNKLSGEISFETVERIQSLDISGNSITSIVFNSENGALDALNTVNIANNSLSFASLPILKSQVNYTYAPQNKVEILSTSAAINLSAQNRVISGKGTDYVWKYADSGAVVPSTEYSLSDGATVFNDTMIGSTVYCEMTNPAFPAFDASPLTTTNVLIASVPTNLVASFVTTQNGTAQIGFRFNQAGNNAVYIDWRGDGTEYEPYIYDSSVTYPSIYRTGTTYAGATVKVYSYDSPELISVFAMMDTPLSSLDLSLLTNLEAADIHNAGLKDGSLLLPESSELWELVLDGNNFENETFGKYPNISTLNLASNNLKTLDLSPYQKLRFAEFANNKIQEVKFGSNQGIIQLDLNNNNLKNISLEGVDYIEELLLSDNNLKEIDLSPLKNDLRVVMLNGNKFNFATLPDVSDMGEQFNYMYYANQQPMEVNCYEYKIDLSSQAYVNGNPTEYYWFLGDFQSDVYYDYNEETFVGEMLEGPEDSSDPEYIVEDGITTFLYPQKRNVICAMVNSELPNLILYTTPTMLSDAGVESLFDADSNGLVDVYTLTGVKVKGKVSITEALHGLSHGVYIIGGKKVLVN